jgi:ATP-dependent exoDNAse (exonuclease V) beta subunit
VACTRAEDHLVVSVHRKSRDISDDTRRTNAELIWAAAHDLAGWDAARLASSNASTDASAVGPPSSNASADALLSFAEWEAEHRRLVDPARAERVVSASALARAAAERAGQLTQVVEDDDGRVEIVVDDPALQKDPRDLELPPWMKGRYGTAIGRAVHAVLQTIDLATGAGLDAAVAAQAAAEGVFGTESRITALVRAALGSDTVRAAVAGRSWRETYVAVPGTDGRLLEGYVDLLYERADGLVVVDYKTDAVGSAADIDQKVAHYRLQGAAYARAVAHATGRPVVACVFVFLTEHGAIERTLPDLAAAVAEVESAV